VKSSQGRAGGRWEGGHGLEASGGGRRRRARESGSQGCAAVFGGAWWEARGCVGVLGAGACAQWEVSQSGASAAAKAELVGGGAEERCRTRRSRSARVGRAEEIEAERPGRSVDLRDEMGRL
jgi:hypothetical protein